MTEYGSSSSEAKTAHAAGVGTGNGSDGLSLRTGKKIVFVDQEAVEVAHLLRGSEGDSKRTTSDAAVREQSNKLLLYLGSRGNRDISGYGDRIIPLLDDDSKGVEADVYLWNNDGEYKVVKVTKWWIRHPTPLEFVENKILAHNILFPETAYQLAGIRYDRGEFLFILEQSYVRSMKGVKVTQQEIDEEMKRRGFHQEGSGYASEHYIISDLNSKNVLKGTDRELYCIDPIIYPKKNKQ